MVLVWIFSVIYKEDGLSVVVPEDIEQTDDTPNYRIGPCT